MYRSNDLSRSECVSVLDRSSYAGCGLGASAGHHDSIDSLERIVRHGAVVRVCREK